MKIMKNSLATMLLLASTWAFSASASAIDFDALKAEIQKTPEIDEVLELLENNETYAEIYFPGLGAEDIDAEHLEAARRFMLRFYGFLLNDDPVDPDYVRSVAKDDSMPVTIRSYAYQLLFFMKGKIDDALLSMEGRPTVGLFYLELGMEDHKVILDKYFEEIEAAENSSFSEKMPLMERFGYKDFETLLDIILEMSDSGYFEKLMVYYPDELVLRGAPAPVEVFEKFGHRMKGEKLGVFMKAVGTSRYVDGEALRSATGILLENYESNFNGK